MSEHDFVGGLMTILQAQGYAVRCEVPFWLHRIDVLANNLITGQVYAIEAKLHNWRKALSQARVYQLCTPMVVVAMPEQFAHRARLADLQACGVGLWSVGSEIVELVCPHRSHVYKPAFAQAMLSDREQKGTVWQW
jgi:hypothetical protein